MSHDSHFENWLSRYESWRAANSAGTFAEFSQERLDRLDPALVSRLRSAAEKLDRFASQVGSLKMPVELRAGESPIEGYRLQARIGRGAFGEVWRAIGPGGIECALKFVPAGGFDAATEMRALEVIRNRRHPHLIAIFG